MPFNRQWISAWVVIRRTAAPDRTRDGHHHWNIHAFKSTGVRGPMSDDRSWTGTVGAAIRLPYGPTALCSHHSGDSRLVAPPLRLRLSSRSMSMIWLRLVASRALPSQLQAAVVIPPPPDAVRTLGRHTRLPATQGCVAANPRSTGVRGRSTQSRMLWALVPAPVTR